MFKEILKSDISVSPFKVYKEWILTETDLTPIYGERITDSLFDRETDPISNGYYKRTIFSSIKTQYYDTLTASDSEKELFPDLLLTDDDFNILVDDDNNLLEVDNPYNTIWILAIPQKYYGEGIKAESVTLIDEVNNITYTDDGNYNLLNDFDDRVNGNIFYDRGLIVMTDVDEDNGELSDFTLSYRSTTTIYENEIFISIAEKEFNISQNPSANDNGFIKYDNFTSSFDGTTTGGFGDYEYSSSVDPTGSYLAPYITTVGLYDDNGTMVAVAKVPEPIKNLPDYPLNFLIRIDT